LKSQYFNNKLNEHKSCSKKLWQTLKNILPKSTKQNPTFLTDTDGTKNTDKKSIANRFNVFFAIIGSKLAQKFTNFQT